MTGLAIAVYLAASFLTMTPQKAEAVVVTTVRPGIFSGAGGITFADQEGGEVRALANSPPRPAAGTYSSAAQAAAAGRSTRRALWRAGVDIDLAPVFDTSDGPLGSRHFTSSKLAVSFARGLGASACAKHFPGLGSAAHSTDERPHVDARVRPKDLAPYRVAIRAGLRCVMVGNAFYGTRFRASLEPSTYRRLRKLGFDGVAITDLLSLVHDAPVERWARVKPFAPARGVWLARSACLTPLSIHGPKSGATHRLRRSQAPGRAATKSGVWLARTRA
jgi:Glycosyl hydrolase family 3 N terminal domain